MSTYHTTPLYVQPLEWFCRQMDRMSDARLRKFHSEVSREMLSRELRALPKEDLVKLYNDSRDRVKKLRG